MNDLKTTPPAAHREPRFRSHALARASNLWPWLRSYAYSVFHPKFRPSYGHPHSGVYRMRSADAGRAMQARASASRIAVLLCEHFLAVPDGTVTEHFDHVADLRPPSAGI